ncbi:MAG: hypothetical protein LW817_02465, partial [Candidatus Caenarcaniphilales bacterium]|nr:hypothetical protein [Candidatus Caenarcaniphilales bacterium]
MAVETFNLWNRKAEQGPKPQFVAVENSTPSTEDNVGSTKPKSKKRTSSPTATNQPRTIRPGILERLNLNSKITLRQAYQKPWLDAFDTNPNSIKFKDSNRQEQVIDFASKAIVSFPGSGLTTTLAAKALQLIREEEPVLILCEHDHSKQKIAQSILDLVEDPEEKQSIKSKLSFDHRGAKAITIVNPTVFQRKQSKTSEQVSNPVEALNPAIKHVLIDEANRYSGDPAEEQSRARIFTDILRQTNSSKDHPTHVYGVSSNPYYDSEDEVHGTRQEQVIEFYKIFLQANVSEGIAYPALKKQGFAREIKFNPIRIESDLKTNALRNVFQADHSNPALTSINNDSALVQLASRSEIKGKTRIMAHSVQSADDLAKIYCVLGKKAAVVTSKHKGFYELVESPQEDEINNLKQFQYNDKTYYLRKVIRDEAALLNGFEHGDIDFIIDYEILNGHDSPKVDNLVLFNASKWGPRMLKALGQSAIAPNQAKALNVYHCEFHNNGELKQDISALLNGILANSNPWDMFLTQVNTNPAASLGTTPAVINPAPSTLAIVNAANNSTILATDERWLEKGLKPIFALLNPRDLIQGEAEYLEKIRKHFGGKLDEDVLFGRKKDPELFQKIIEFNFAILKKYSNASDNYSSLERYQSHLASIVPDLMKLEVDNHDFAVKLIADIYRNAPIKPDASWLKRLDQLLKIHPSASEMDKKQLRSEKFAEVLYKLYGKEFFVFPANAKNAIEVFTGQTTNKFLLTYLLQSLSSSSAEIDQIKQEFPQLFAKNSSRNFKSLQKQILSKFPEAPQAAQIKEFLTQTLYKELGIDLVTLINAAIIGASTDDQQIRSHSDLKQDLNDFLQKLEESLFAQEKALIEGDQFNQEIQKLVNEHIEPITQEIIFSQLMHKIWPDAAIRTTSHQSEHRSSDASPDTVTTSVKGIKADDRFEAIDLLQADKNWLKVISDQTNTVVDFEALSGYQIGIKARLMTAINSFENSIDKSLTTREMKVLTGIEMPHDDAERNLVRSFLQFIQLDPKELVVQFPQRLGVTTPEEAQLLVAKALEGIKYRNKFTDATKNITLSADKLAEFFFGLSPELLLDREKLVIRIRELNDNNESTTDTAEKTRRQNNLRFYIGFCETQYGEPKLADLVTKFPLRLGIRSKEELKAIF